MEDWQSVASENADEEDEAQMTFWASVEGRTSAPEHWQDMLPEDQKQYYGMTTSDADTTAGEEESESDTPGYTS